MKKIVLLVIVLYFFNGKSQEIDYSKFEGSSVEINNETSLSDSFLFDYKDSKDSIIYSQSNEINNPERMVIYNNKEIFKKQEKPNQNYVKFDYKISFKYNGIPFQFIRYELYKDLKLFKIEIAEFENKGDLWNKVELNELKSLKSIMLKNNIESFWNLYLDGKIVIDI